VPPVDRTIRHVPFPCMALPKRKVPPPREWVGDQRKQPWSELDRYDRASPAVDCVLFTITDGRLGVVVHRRLVEPEKGHWALPGVFVNYGESFAEAAHRALKMKVGFERDLDLHQVGIDNQPYRDERGWVITVTLVGLFPANELEARLDRAQRAVAAVPVSAPAGYDIAEQVKIELPDPSQVALALGHNRLVGLGLEWLRHQIYVSDEALDLMPETFTLRQLQDLFETILGDKVNKDSFRRSVTKSRALVEPTGIHTPVLGRIAAELYRRAGD